MADTQWNIEHLLATAVAYMRDVGMPNEADAIIELQRRAATQPADAALADALEAASNRCHGQDVAALRKAASALRARPQAVAEVYCVGRANYPQRGGNVGLQWHVVGVADVPYRTCVPKNGELLFVLAASQSATGTP